MSAAARALGDWRWTLVALVLGVGVVAQFVTVGGDWDWLVAMGDHVRRTGAVPDDVPFAVADTGGWHDVPVLAQLLASALHDLGARAVVVAHLLATCVALAVLAATARARGASDAAVAGAVAAVVLGSLSTLGVVRAQTFSLVPFAVLLALLVRQHRRPDRGIWWAVPLVAVWGNLHGAVLMGVCVLGAYLVVDRLPRRPLETVVVGAASLLALCATPQLWSTPAYYLAVLRNVSAERHEGLWARPSPGSPFDVLMLLAGLALLVVVLRRRRPLWEYVAVAGLCLATASAARHGVWLLFLLAVLVPAPRPGGDRPRGPDVVRGAVAVGLVAVVVAVPVALLRGPAVLGASPAVVARVAEVVRAEGSASVLAPAPLSEALAVSGARLWAGNPLDAFGAADQAAFLDFIDGDDGGRVAVGRADLVVVEDGSRPEALVRDDPAFEPRPCGDGWTCYVRR
ncbi:hypothetical protein [Nocardioides zeicaulis]|uniref:Glycosyltransferase RgtA/B/C/D-like domain-containing protein n=1 Tax=Nocardioides zeicaulis TaxID=1776857 RepID=A0ABV6DX91_9ACTN